MRVFLACFEPPAAAFALLSRNAWVISAKPNPPEPPYFSPPFTAPRVYLSSRSPSGIVTVTPAQADLFRARACQLHTRRTNSEHSVDTEQPKAPHDFTSATSSVTFVRAPNAVLRVSDPC